jgi:hypothetical protein
MGEFNFNLIITSEQWFQDTLCLEFAVAPALLFFGRPLFLLRAFSRPLRDLANTTYEIVPAYIN